MKNDVNRQLSLRALEPQDIDALYRWENDPTLWETSESHAPFSRLKLQQYIVDSLQEDIYASRQLRLIAMDGVVAVGCIDLFDFDPLNLHAEIGVLVDQQWRQMGYGKAMLQALEDYCRDNLHIHSLSAEVAEDNEASLRLFAHSHYEKIGEREEYLNKGGKWCGVWIFQKILES